MELVPQQKSGTSHRHVSVKVLPPFFPSCSPQGGPQIIYVPLMITWDIYIAVRNSMMLIAWCVQSYKCCLF